MRKDSEINDKNQDEWRGSRSYPTFPSEMERGPVPSGSLQLETPKQPVFVLYFLNFSYFRMDKKSMFYRGVWGVWGGERSKTFFLFCLSFVGFS